MPIAYIANLFFTQVCSLYISENGDCCDTTIDLSYQELGIAKLSRFLEWLSIHPIISEKVGENVNSHKMIIFAHHHKVLDGIQVRNVFSNYHF